jgi:AcrR family transcriptional regulator
VPSRTAGYMLRKRQAILAAAQICFAERGVLETTMADIARQAGTSAGALYKHFENRDDVLEAVISDMMEGFYQERSVSTWCDLRKALLDYAFLEPVVDDQRMLVRSVHSQSIGLILLKNPVLRRKTEESFARAESWLAAGLTKLDQAGDIRLPVPADAAARHLIDVIMGCSLSVAFRKRDPAEFARSIDAFVGVREAG